VEREKSDILLRRIAALDTAPSKTAASEVQYTATFFNPNKLFNILHIFKQYLKEQNKLLLVQLGKRHGEIKDVETMS
jgi:hypothetical protein